MKILNLCTGRDADFYFYPLLQGFQRIGHDLKRFSVVRHRDFEGDLAKCIEDYKPDIILTIGWFRPPDAIIWDVLRRYSIPHVYWAIEDSTYFDIVSTVHLKEYALVLTISEKCISKYAQLGMKAYYIPHTIDPELHKPLDNPDPQFASDIIVTANSFRAGSSENIFRRENFNYMAKPLILGGYDIKVHGSHWEPEKLGLPKSNFVGYSPLTYIGHIYSGAKIVVGIQRNFDGHICFRTFEALSYGRLLITPYTPVQEEFFTHEKHLIYAHNEEEAKQYVDYYLTHPDQREKIALAGQEEVHKNHNCAVRAQQAVAAIKDSGII